MNNSNSTGMDPLALKQTFSLKMNVKQNETDDDDTGKYVESHMGGII